MWRYPAERRLEVPPLITTRPQPLAVIADRGGTVTAIRRSLSLAESEAAGQWLEAAAIAAKLGQPARAAELLQSHGEPLKAAQLWHVAGQLEPAARQYQAAGAWSQAANLWQQLNRPQQRAEALEQYARSLTGQAADDEDRIQAWEVAGQAWTAAGITERTSACQAEVARYRRLPELVVEVKHGPLVLNAWTQLRFIVHNRGHGVARNLIIRARGGQFEGQVAETRQIMTLQAEQTRQDWLDIRPLAHGESVPLRVSIDYQDRLGADHTWQETLYLPVARAEASASDPSQPDKPQPDPSPVSHSPAAVASADKESREETSSPGQIDFFVSYNRHDKQWAEWIAWQLEEAGYTTIIQAWDFRPGGNFVADMQRATAEAERTIAVLSPDYLASSFTQPEWNAAFAQDPTGAQGLLLPVRVRECELAGLLPQIVYIDLVGLDQEAAKGQLLAGVKRGRAKPATEPGFPGEAKHAASEPPDFPG